MKTSSGQAASWRRYGWLGLPVVLAGACLAFWLFGFSSPKARASNDLTESISIHAIQGAGHRSIYAGQVLSGVLGIVTAKRSSGFYLQERTPDADIATSEGIFVYLGERPSLLPGDFVSVTALVEEDYPFSLSPGSLSVTRLTTVITDVQVISSGLALPAAVIVGLGGRVPPDQIIEDDASNGNVETSGVFDPESDALDFYESLEGMRIQVNNPLAVGPTDGNGIIPVVGDGGALAGMRTARGGVLVQPADFNPERILIEDAIVTSEPRVSTGAQFDGAVTGVLDYTLGDFKLFNSDSLPALATTGVISETALDPLPEQLSVATLNTENMDALDSPTKFNRLAAQIVARLQSPDIVVLSEIQDNNGSLNDAVVSADQTYASLIAAIQAAGGPLYQWRDINPLDDQDGGQVGGNIRVGFLFRADRGLAFVDRLGGDALTPVTATLETTGVELSFSPGRIDPSNPAFYDSRKPLAAEFTFRGHKLILIACHLISKSGDSPLFGRYQPPREPSQVQRSQQAAVINAFAQHILSLDAEAALLVLGDMNDFDFSLPLAALQGSSLTNLLSLLPANERYTYVYSGNSQALDHILVSDFLLDHAVDEIDIVHLNAEFPAAVRPTDHDPVLVRLTIPDPPPRLYLPYFTNSSGT